MYFPSDEYRSIVTIPFKFSAVRIFGRNMNPTELTAKLACTPAKSDERTPKKIEEASQEGMQRLTFWWDTIMDNVVIIDVQNEVIDNIVSSIENNVMFCPGLPSDHLIVELLHSKISAITKGFFDIHSISLRSEDTNGIETMFRNIDGYNLPGIEYFPSQALHLVPWWERDTIEVCEFVKDAVVEDELYNHFSDFFGSSKEEADIIIFRSDDEDGQVQ